MTTLQMHQVSQQGKYFLYGLDNTLDKYNENYEKFLLIGNFNAEDSEPNLAEFIYECKAHNIAKKNIF